MIWVQSLSPSDQTNNNSSPISRILLEVDLLLKQWRWVFYLPTSPSQVRISVKQSSRRRLFGYQLSLPGSCEIIAEQRKRNRADERARRLRNRVRLDFVGYRVVAKEQQSSSSFTSSLTSRKKISFRSRQVILYQSDRTKYVRISLVASLRTMRFSPLIVRI